MAAVKDTCYKATGDSTCGRISWLLARALGPATDWAPLVPMSLPSDNRWARWLLYSCGKIDIIECSIFNKFQCVKIVEQNIVIMVIGGPLMCPGALINERRPWQHWW